MDRFGGKSNKNVSSIVPVGLRFKSKNRLIFSTI